MSLHWKQNSFLIITITILLLLALIIILCLPFEKNIKNPVIVAPKQHEMPAIDDSARKTYYTNRSLIDDYDWTIAVDENDLANDVNGINNSLPEDLMSDFVKPIKVHDFALNADDLLYESKRNHNKDKSNKKDYFSAFSVTGTFRSKSDQIWDPHPEYILNTFGHRLHLMLHHDTSFIPSKTFRVLHILNNSTEEDDEETHYLGCYYKGYVQGDDQSAVAVSLCNGMTGYIKTGFGSLLIQPVNQVKSDTGDVDGSILHKVWRHSRRNARHAISSADLGLDLQSSALEQNIAPPYRLSRKKRSYDDIGQRLFTMEVLIAVDRSMIEFHKDDLKAYILNLISIVSNIFSDASIGNAIQISVTNILLLKDDLAAARNSRRRTTSASQLLRLFCNYLMKRNYHYDTAMLITRDQICRNERGTKCDTLGLAELGTVCKPHSCSIVQDNGLPAAFTIAHELGHILNIPHDDDDDRCKAFITPGIKPKLHIMSSIMGDDIHPWSWSDCSRYHVSEFLEKEDKTCLEDTPRVYISNPNTRLPGEIYSLDHQCKLIHGNRSRFCYIDGECKELWCKTDEHYSDCRSSNLPWADGTPCANNKRFWCQKGECVAREGVSRHMVHGGWGPWSPFTPCSLTCGGGVQESQRECNNPLPKNRGNYCAGSRKKYRSCNTQSCPSGSMDSREQQCYDMNGRNFGLKGIERSAKWIPKYGLNPNDKCKLYCRLEDNSAYFKLSDKVKDGTTCSFDSFDKCVNGICRPAGCDNELNSMAKLDKCGVCEGRNDTCEEFTGNFYVSDLYKLQPKSKSYYYYVATIPRGASNIEITQIGYPDENYIVLRDDQNNSVLNGNKLISTYRNVSFYAGLTFDYNGSNNTIERVHTTYARKLKRDLVIEIISLSTVAEKNNDSVLLTYAYTMDRPSNDEPEIVICRWEMQRWSNCDALCHGNSYRLPVCVNTVKALKVAPQFCDMNAKPPTEHRACNTECVLSLNVTSVSECSAACGTWGTREKSYQCIQTFYNSRHSNVVDMAYCLAKFELTQFERCREGCWDYTEWSPCSKSCGTGVQTRGVACYLDRIRVSDSLCNARKKNLNDLLQTCNIEPCRDNFWSYYEDNSLTTRSVVPNNWMTGEWGECDDKCEKNRTVSCRNPHSYGCLRENKPLSKKKCCKIKYVSSWSNCSVDCGSGVRHKEVHCARVYKPEIKGTPRRRVYIDQYYCRHLRKPTPKRTKKPCKNSCKWSTSDWTQCFADCSSDYQSRSVYCESMMGNPIAYHYCEPSKKPVERRICSNCVRRESRLISGCNCEGYRRRRVLCYDSTRKRIPCPMRQKVIKEKCQPPHECQPQSCADLRRLRQHYHDREYTIFVRSRPIKIYCHNMKSSTPKEYITINPTENYSIYYDYKTEDPDRCPPESRRREYRDNNISSGRTRFRKVRIDIAELRVIEDDFTFAETSGIQQPYGSAGDCYNRNMQCPQGDFSINLDHTGFVLRPGTVWDQVGNSVVMQLSSTFNSSLTSRRALCGGYCGRCSISAHRGLYLNVV